MNEILDKALTLKSDVDWRTLFTTAYVGFLPKSVVGQPGMIIFIFESLIDISETESKVIGSYEFQLKPPFAQTDIFDGHFNLKERSFSVKGFDTKDPWTITGELSENGLVIHVSITHSNSISERFSAIHENTFDALTAEP